MKVAVFGLGYVGCVSAACLAELGHTVTGVDVNAAKVDQVNEGRAPILEPGLSERLSAAAAAGTLRATTSAADAIREAEVALICVGTPSAETGSIDYSHLRHVAEEIGEAITPGSGVIIAVRSTVMADVVLREVLPGLEGRHARRGPDFELCINPEFLREGTAVRDFHAPPFTLIGASDRASGERLAALYAGVDAPIIHVDLHTAGLIKYASNAFHALKVVFANELGVLCEEVGADSHEVMRVFCQDTKLNISPAYLKPGFAFGGSCLPKDVRAVLHRARHADLDLPVLGSILRSNSLHIERAVDAVRRTGHRRVGVVGLSFKPDTDDLRESPLVILIEQLIGRGFDVRVFDPEVTMSRVFGGNRAFIDRAIPHITALMRDSVDDLVEASEVLVVGKPLAGLDAALARVPSADQVVIDLNHFWPRSTTSVEGRSLIRIC